jgi:hypothetical protein
VGKGLILEQSLSFASFAVRPISANPATPIALLGKHQVQWQLMLQKRPSRGIEPNKILSLF